MPNNGNGDRSLFELNLGSFGFKFGHTGNGSMPKPPTPKKRTPMGQLGISQEDAQEALKDSVFAGFQEYLTQPGTAYAEATPMWYENGVARYGDDARVSKTTSSLAEVIAKAARYARAHAWLIQVHKVDLMGNFANILSIWPEEDEDGQVTTMIAATNPLDEMMLKFMMVFQQSNDVPPIKPTTSMRKRPSVNNEMDIFNFMTGQGDNS